MNIEEKLTIVTLFSVTRWQTTCTLLTSVKFQARATITISRQVYDGMRETFQSRGRYEIRRETSWQELEGRS